MERMSDFEQTESPSEEWEIERMRPSGPGGQAMQKTESKVRVRWYFDASTGLAEDEKEKLREAFPEGYIEAVSQRTRSQRKNLAFAKETITRRAEEIVADTAERIATGVPPSERARRLEEKRRVAAKKLLRKKVEESGERE